MREHNNGVAILGTVVFMVLFLAIAGWISDISTPKCIKTGCDNDQAKDSSSYDDGYDDVYENDDFDWDRYYNDDDYADGIDDARRICYVC